MIEVSCIASALKFVERTRLQCMHGCLHYKRHPMCPPASPDISWFKSLFKSYERATVLYEIIHFTDSIELLVRRNKFNSKLIEREQLLKKQGYHFALGFTSGACSACENKACNAPECTRLLTGRAPVCAVGIDLMHLCTEMLYLPLHNALSYWIPNLSRNYFEERPDHYLGLGLILY